MLAVKGIRFWEVRTVCRSPEMGRWGGFPNSDSFWSWWHFRIEIVEVKNRWGWAHPERVFIFAFLSQSCQSPPLIRSPFFIENFHIKVCHDNSGEKQVRLKAREQQPAAIPFTLKKEISKDYIRKKKLRLSLLSGCKRSVLYKITKQRRRWNQA